MLRQAQSNLVYVAMEVTWIKRGQGRAPTLLLVANLPARK